MFGERTEQQNDGVSIYSRVFLPRFLSGPSSRKHRTTNLCISSRSAQPLRWRLARMCLLDELVGNHHIARIAAR